MELGKPNNNIYIYFTQCYEKGRQIKIKFESYYLEPFNTFETKNDKNIEYDINVYRLNIKPYLSEIKNGENFKIKLLLEDKEKGNFWKIIDKINFQQSIFLFDNSFKPRPTFFTEIKPPEQYPLTSQKQYETYRRLLKDDEPEEITALVDSAKNLFKDCKYDFSFFVSVFSDIILIKDLIAYSLLFEINNVDKIGVISQEKLFKAKTLVNLNYNKLINDTLEKIGGELKEMILEKIVLFLVYFDYHYQKDNINDLLHNEKINNFTYKSLIKNKKLFTNLHISKYHINKFISKANDYEELLDYLHLTSNFLVILEIINENKDLFIKLIKENIKKIEEEKEKEKKEKKEKEKKEKEKKEKEKKDKEKKGKKGKEEKNKKEEEKKEEKKEDEENEIELENKIYMEKYVEQKETDNMSKIKVEIEKLISIEKSIKINFVYFSRKFLDNYIKIYNEKNIDDLLNLLEIIKLIKANEKNISYRFTIKALINKCLSLAEKGLIKNMNLLLFIENNNQIIIMNNKKQITLDIFNCIDIHTVNTDFIKKWKTIKWSQLFDISDPNFYKKICELVKEMKDFGKLFSLFDINEKEKDYNEVCLKEMNNAFISLLETYSEKECYDFIDVTSDLIFLLNIKNIEITTLIKDFIFNYLGDEIINKIFYNILKKDKYNIFKDELTQLIIEFYEGKPKFINPLYLAFYINIKKNLNNNHLLLLNTFIVQPHEIYNLEELDNFILLKKLIEGNYLDNPLLNSYVESSRLSALIIIEDISSGNIEYASIEKFYFNNKEKELFQRINLINNLINNGKSNSNENICIDAIEKNMNTINQIINDLEIVKKKLELFFPNAKKADIIKIDEIIKDIKKKDLLYYKTIKPKYDHYLKQKEINSLTLDLKNANIFFKAFYKENSQLYKNNELKIMQETEKELDKFINIIKTNNIKDDDQINYLCKILNKLPKEEIDNMSQELGKLIEQNKINTIRDKDRMANELILISKKNIIFECVENFVFFIENTGVEQEEFTQINKTIIKYLKKPSDINVIDLSLELLKNYNIEFNNNTNYKFLNVLNMLKNKKNIIQFLINVKIDNFIDYFNRNNLEKGNIDSLIECKNFFDKVFSKHIKDKELIKNFINNINESNKIEENFINLVYNFDVIIDFYNFMDLN